MNKRTLYGLAVAIPLLCASSLPLAAHSLERLLTIAVPFEFQVNEQVFPAGQYVIERGPQIPRLLHLHSREQHISAVVYTITLDLSQTTARTGLTFREYGGKPFLAKVRVAGRDVGYELIKSKAEHRLAQLTQAKTIQARRASEQLK